MRKNFFFLVIVVCICVISADAQVNFRAAPDRNAKATLALLTQHTELSETSFGNTGWTLVDYYKEISNIHNDHNLSAEAAKSAYEQSGKALNEKLKVIFTKEQMEIWVNTIQPDIEKQLRDN